MFSNFRKRLVSSLCAFSLCAPSVSAVDNEAVKAIIQVIVGQKRTWGEIDEGVRIPISSFGERRYNRVFKQFFALDGNAWKCRIKRPNGAELDLDDNDDLKFLKEKLYSCVYKELEVDDILAWLGIGGAFVGGIAGVGSLGMMSFSALSGFLDRRRRARYQREFDAMSKAKFGDSSIDFRRNWKEVEKKLKALKEEYPHNAGEIDRIIGRIRGFYIGCQNGAKGKCLLISLSGPPGCGKTSLCLKIAEILGARRPVVVGYSDVDPNNKQLSERQQVNGSWSVSVGDSVVREYGKVVASIKNNSHPVMIFDEFDKVGDSLKTLLWDLADSGRINVMGEDVVIDGGLFFLPCNAPLASTIKKDEKMTSQAFASRFFSCSLRAPDKSSYEKIFRKIFDGVASMANKKYGMSLSCDDSVVGSVAEACVSKQMGFRCFQAITDLLYSAVAGEGMKEGYVSGSKYDLRYDTAADSFSLSLGSRSPGDNSKSKEPDISKASKREKRGANSKNGGNSRSHKSKSGHKKRKKA